MPSGYTEKIVLEDDEGNTYRGTKKEEQNITEIKIDKTRDYTMAETSEEGNSEENTGKINQAGESTDFKNQKPSRVKKCSTGCRNCIFVNIVIIFTR